MDLSNVITHLDNFVDTWEGWHKVLGSFQEAFGSFFGAIGFIGDNGIEAVTPELSSLSSK
ncbi:hypothetical protein ACKFRL_05425 [Corynebacterium marquesiae]|uniref:hypothetical protein n=1 Tax=Corynebacterium TaxID=1716 RepID=UPI001EF4C2B3|nr:hypothetical protein [Corynebacterium tuberculostearicum]MCG7447331.1 hypothetical protein [Corynebacterium aurimucosum]WKE50721.1 hypothetical protein J8244_11530 [Corynebacterium tuberculostearicum]